MPQQNNIEKVETMDILIGVTIFVCLVFCHIVNAWGIPIEALAVTTGAIMCVQDSTKAAFATSLTRMIGVVVGGMFGIGIILIDSAVGIPFVFYLLCSAGVVATIVVCKFFKMIYVQARVSGITMLLVTMVFEGMVRMEYAVNRFIGGLVGAVLSLLVSLVFVWITKRMKKED